MRTDTSSSQGRPTAGLHWWRQVIDPAEEEFLRTTCPQGTRTILPVCANCHRQVAWSSRYHTHACFTCDRWLSARCERGCTACDGRPVRPSQVSGAWG